MQIGTLLNLFGILFVVHWLVYLYLVLTFKIKTRKHKVILTVVLILLSLSFFLSAIFLRFHDGLLSKIVYFAATFWVGVLINLLVVIIPSFLIVGILRLFKVKLKFKIVGVIGLVIMGFLSVWGVWKAYNPEITEIDVYIEQLPEGWDGKHFVQLSDLHLGGNLGEFFLEDVVERVNMIKPEFVVLTGDLVDGSVSSPGRYLDLLDDLESSYGSFFITGNHEEYAGVQWVLKSLEKSSMIVLDNEVVEIDGLQIVGASYPSLNQPDQKPVKELILEDSNFDPEKANILLFHSPISVNGMGEENETNHTNMYWKPLTDFSDTKDLGIDLQLSGHTHHGQMFPFQFLTDYIYSGYDYGLHVEDGFSLYTSSGTGVWGPPMRTGSRSEIVVITLHKK